MFFDVWHLGSVISFSTKTQNSITKREKCCFFNIIWVRAGELIILLGKIFNSFPKIVGYHSFIVILMYRDNAQLMQGVMTYKVHHVSSRALIATINTKQLTVYITKVPFLVVSRPLRWNSPLDRWYWWRSWRKKMTHRKIILLNINTFKHAAKKFIQNNTQRIKKRKGCFSELEWQFIVKKVKKIKRLFLSTFFFIKTDCIYCMFDFM